MTDHHSSAKPDLGWLGFWLRPFGRDASRSRAESAPKLPRIEDILARTGREPPQPE
jgi:hypothetical protein